jgi:hypothetical protein
MNRSENNPLKEWKLDASVPPNFNSAVWRKIEARSTQSMPKVFAAWIERHFAKPSVAFSYAVVTLMIGLGAGQFHASQEVRKTTLSLEARYVQSIDPYTITSQR